MCRHRFRLPKGIAVTDEAIAEWLWQERDREDEEPGKREPATDEERMRVLRMVEEGKITPEQAAELLAAVEGR